MTDWDAECAEFGCHELIEPWATLLGHLAGRYLFRDYLDGPTPHLKALKADERYPGLSSGEQAMVEAAEHLLGLYECSLVVDDHNRRRIAEAIGLSLGMYRW
jgi:hypothetical protein